MDPVTRCLHCGKRMVPMHSHSGRTELKCVFCDRLDAHAKAMGGQSTSRAHL
jgi:hypothetical protein